MVKPMQKEHVYNLMACAMIVFIINFLASQEECLKCLQPTSSRWLLLLEVLHLKGYVQPQVAECVREGICK